MFARSRRFTCSNDDSKEENDDSTEFIRVIGTEVYFCGEVSQETVLELNVALRKLQRDLIVKCADLGIEPPEITLYINSSGGCVFSGLSAMDHIRTMRIPVTTVVDGCCCSAATFMLLGGHNRLMKENSFVLIHQITNTFWGKFEEMKDDMETVSKLMEHIKNIYRRETKVTESKLKKFMKRDIYLNSEECIRYGIVNGFFPLVLKSVPEDENEDENDE